MKRKLILAALIFLCFILQTTIFKMSSFLIVSPNLMLIASCAIGFMQGKKEGIMAGFFAGIITDLTYGALYGRYALIYLLIGWFCGRYANIYFDEDLKVPLALISGSDLVFNLYVYVTGFLFRGRLDFGFYLKNIMLPEMIWTFLVGIVLYRILYVINHALMEKEKEGRQSLWIRE